VKVLGTRTIDQRPKVGKALAACRRADYRPRHGEHLDDGGANLRHGGQDEAVTPWTPGCCSNPLSSEAACEYHEG